MTQAHQVLTTTVTAFGGITVGLAAVVALKLARGDRPSRAAQLTAPGVVPTGYRYCPAEQRTRAATLHTDQSARCLDCGAHIPAGDR